MAFSQCSVEMQLECFLFLIKKIWHDHLCLLFSAFTVQSLLKPHGLFFVPEHFVYCQISGCEEKNFCVEMTDPLLCCLVSPLIQVPCVMLSWEQVSKSLVAITHIYLRVLGHFLLSWCFGLRSFWSGQVLSDCVLNHNALTSLWSGSRAVIWFWILWKRKCCGREKVLKNLSDLHNRQPYPRCTIYEKQQHHVFAFMDI